MPNTSDTRAQLVVRDAHQPLQIETLALRTFIFDEIAAVYKYLTARAGNSTEDAFHIAARNCQSISTDLSPRIYLFDVLATLCATRDADEGKLPGAGLAGSLIRRIYLKCESHFPEMTDVFSIFVEDMPTVDVPRHGARLGKAMFVINRIRDFIFGKNTPASGRH